MFGLIQEGLFTARTLGLKIADLSHRSFSTTSALLAEPPRKRRRVDPVILRSRVEKKMMKHEREIKKLENEPRQLIPILEYQPTNSTIRDWFARPGRTLEDVGIDERKLKAAQKLWNFYRLEQSRRERRLIRQVERAQARALETLEQLNEDLFKKTVTVDDVTLIPYISSHMRKDTAPNPNYTPPDGYIKDISKVWVM